MTTTARFASPFAADLDAFLSVKRASGRRYDRAAFRLRSLDRFLVQHAKEMTGAIELASAIPIWLARRGSAGTPATIHMEFSVARQFCLFLRRHDPDCFVPGSELAPSKSGRRFLPYIFSVEEVRRLLRGTDALKILKASPCPRFLSIAYHMIIMVLFCTGLRLGEAVRLRLEDVDLRRRTFFIRDSKGRSRWVPFDTGLARHLRVYLQARSSVATPGAPFFVKATGRAYCYVSSVGIILRHLFRRLGLKPSRGRRGPRVHDIRHSFAVHRLTRWYHDGVDLHSRLPWLSAYMGHDDLLGTQRYLTATPELLELASRRFAARLRRRSDHETT
jgi:integrase/recombinase XerD